MDFKGLFSNLIGKKNSSVLGVDIGSSAIKIVELQKKAGKPVLKTYGALALGPYASVEIGKATNLAPEKITEALTDILRESKSGTKDAGVAIPIKSSLISLIEMPAVPQRELEQMVPLEARKYIPVPISEVALDWSVIPRDEFSGSTEPSQTAKAPLTDVLIVAIHNEILEKYQDIITKTGLNVSFFEIEVFSTMRSVLDESEKRPVMIFDMGAALTRIYIIERGVVRESHSINKGSQDITDAISKSLGVPFAKAEEMKRASGLSAATDESKKVSEIVSLTLDYIFSEANRVVINYQRKSKKAVSKIVLVGGGSALKGLANEANRVFGADVTISNPFAQVESPAFLERVLREVGPEFAVALGIALRKLQELE